MKILITGGAGFIGSNLAEHWLSKGCRVTVFDNLSRPGGGAKKNMEYLTNKYKGNPDFEFIQGDVRNLEQLKKVVKGVDIIFHVAAQTAMTTSIDDPVEDFETNARGTFNVLEAARSSDSDPIIVYTSTNKVYGDLTRKTVELAEKEKRWDFADDHCRALDTVIQKGKPGEIYNIAADNERTNLEIVEAILDAVGKPRSLITFVKDRPGHDRRYALDIEKIKHQLGWEPATPFEEGIRKTVEWYMQNESWWRRIKSGEYAEYYDRMYSQR